MVFLLTDCRQAVSANIERLPGIIGYSLQPHRKRIAPLVSIRGYGQDSSSRSARARARKLRPGCGGPSFFGACTGRLRSPVSPVDEGEGRTDGRTDGLRWAA